MIRARLVRGQTCSSAPGVVAGAELAPSLVDGKSGDDPVSCTTAFCCFLAFFLWLLVICSICSQCKNGHVSKGTAASDDLVIRYMQLDTVDRSQSLQACIGPTNYDCKGALVSSRVSA